MSIDANVTNTTEVKAQATPPTITVSQILADLDAGIDRNGIAIKYSISKKEVGIMFQHPSLKGKRPKKAKVLSFTLVDDTAEVSEAVAEGTVASPEMMEENDLATKSEEMHSNAGEAAEDNEFDNYLND